jgi:hypothetical protein
MDSMAGSGVGREGNGSSKREGGAEMELSRCTVVTSPIISSSTSSIPPGGDFA